LPRSNALTRKVANEAANILFQATGSIARFLPCDTGKLRGFGWSIRARLANFWRRKMSAVEMINHEAGIEGRWFTLVLSEFNLSKKDIEQ